MSTQSLHAHSGSKKESSFITHNDVILKMVPQDIKGHTYLLA